MPLHHRPRFSHHNPPSPKLREIAQQWATREFTELRREASSSLFHGLWQNHFEKGGVLQRAYDDFALKVIHAITYTRGSDGIYRRRLHPSWARERRSTRETRLAVRYLEYLSGAPGTPRHPHVCKLDRQKLLDCLLEEVSEPYAHLHDIQMLTSVLLCEVTARNPASLFHALFARHRRRADFRHRSQPIDAISSLQLPTRFLQKTYELDSGTYAVFSLETAKDLEITSALSVNCLHQPNWWRRVFDGEILVLCVSRLLPTPTPLAEMSLFADKRRLWKRLKTPHEPCVLLHVDIASNTCTIKQCKTPLNRVIHHGTPLYWLMFKAGVLADIHRELTRRYGSVRGFGHDFSKLRIDGYHLTIDGIQKTTDALDHHDTVVVGSHIEIDPEKTSIPHLQKLAAIDSVYLGCSKLFRSNSPHARALCASLRKVYGTIVYKGAALLLTSNRFPNLVSVSHVLAQKTPRVVIDLPNLTTANNIEAFSSQHVAINAPTLRHLSSLYAPRAETFSMHTPKLRSLNTLDISQLQDVDLNLPELRRMIDLTLNHAKSVSVTAPKLLIMNEFTASLAKEVYFHTPHLQHLKDFIAPRVHQLTLYLPNLLDFENFLIGTPYHVDIAMLPTTLEKFHTRLEVKLDKLIRELNDVARNSPAAGCD